MEKYEKVKKIGEGSFGKAILVKSKEDESQYVIKEISISRMSSQERQESRKEVAVLANMRHPNIVQYKESFEEGGCLYIVMDYCEGGDLFKKINSQKGVLFSEDQILNWFVQICLALKHVHDRKILHRDIKSQNIFLTKNGTVQLGDFGIARVLNSTVELARTWIGTPYYLSPEICENKPYNNKSDIWALGCVLYEMCTLKHAFEAGNMKNLVLKIIRGSYPPVSVHYSQDLRSLLAQLFKRSPRERPSVNSILDKPFLAGRIERFLSPEIIAQEFHHHVLHKQPKAGAVPGPAAKRSAPGCTPVTPAQKITKPACKPRVPLIEKLRKASDAAKKAAERKPAAKHKPEGCRKKKMELIEKERKKREQMFLLKAEQMKRYEKEKLNRINQAREQGWKHVLSLSGGSSPERKCFVGGVKRAAPGAVQGPAPGPLPNKNLYEHHYAALDQLAKPQTKTVSAEGSAGPGSPIRGVHAAVAPGPPNGPSALLNTELIKRELQKLQGVPYQPHFSRQRAQVARGRAHQVEEFLQRKREAMLNKVRAEGQLGARQNLAAIFGCRAGALRCRRPKANKEEEEYLSRLRQIRLQNFNERQQIKARLRGERYDSDGSDSQESTEEAALRRKKIEALKAQANARAAVLKEQLEKKRREAHEKEKKAWEDHLAARGMKVSTAAAGNAAEALAASSTSQSPPPESNPPQQEPAAKAPVLPVPQIQTSSAVSMTAALKNVGAITPMKESLPDLERATIIQSEKKEILRRLNQNLKESPVAEAEALMPTPGGPCGTGQEPHTDAGEQPSPSRDRKKWEAAELFALPVPQQTLEETCSTINASCVSPEQPPSSGGDRKRWEAGVVLVPSVAQQTLEETSLATVEQTAGAVIQMCRLHEEEAPRKVWPVKPDSQVLRVLQAAELQPLTQELGNVSLCDDDSSSPEKPNLRAPTELVKTPDKMSPSGLIAVPSPEVQKEHATRASPQEISVAAALPPGLTDPQDYADVESLVLEEEPQQVLRAPTEVQEAWEQGSQQQMPPGGNPGPVCCEEEEKSEEKPNESSEEPLFMKLCSPAHRRTAALAILSAQSSVDDSSSSLTSRSRSVSPLRSKHHNALLIGLSTGMFDTNNPKMLRTCSLPDLSRLFDAQQSSAVTDANAAQDNNLEVEDLDEAAKDEEQSENEDVSEYEDLRNIQASMERLLHEEGELMGCTPEVNAGDFNGNPPEGQELFNSLTTEIDQDNNNMVVDDDDEADEDEEEEDDGDKEEAEEEDCSNGSPAEEDHSNNSQLNEEWHSDGSGEDQCAEAPYHDSIFSRLEELRFNLEQQMGLEKCIQAYNKIKAIHEDEDENIDQGSSLVLSILGTEHQHLYPNILHLVMADGAYQEGNDA
ncbi:serine/threonine-protein kinase Nek1 isoform X2 [Takifugu rubripes]|uniref:serine/threonine-protein kinase Nek1 isoform X2 n=1 Tax=Takifugu rubripes TaxID=31033 RepID=UPI0011459F3A|nr:serine/threonine-protein kinase Nek1 isoform X2 [Takifugu rubripes]